jgi:hypothetical protein
MVRKLSSVALRAATDQPNTDIGTRFSQVRRKLVSVADMGATVYVQDHARDVA